MTAMSLRHSRPALCSLMASVFLVLFTGGAWAEGAHPKNWTPPSYKIYGQQLCDEIIAAHPELISVTFHGVPPGKPVGTYTMFAGSFPDRIGNVDDPDDIMVSEKGITILDPRWHKTHDPIAKFVVMMPLRTANAENIGLLVLAYHNPPNMQKSAGDFLAMATALRDRLQFKIRSAVRSGLMQA